MPENKLKITCVDSNGIDEDILSKAISIENLLIASGETPQGYSRIDLLRLAIEMKKIEILEDIEEDLVLIRNAIKEDELEFGDIEYNDPC